MHLNQIVCRLHTLDETPVRRGTSEPFSLVHWLLSPWVFMPKDDMPSKSVEDNRLDFVCIDHVASLVEQDMLPFFLLSIYVTQLTRSYQRAAYIDLLFSYFRSRVRSVPFDYSLTPLCPIEYQ